VTSTPLERELLGGHSATWTVVSSGWVGPPP
jgi:hypothetical protein